MNASTRIIVNTGAQYSRALFCALLSLYSTRLILHVLGMSDYGIYTLIAGVVALLGFLTNALVITTQRYLSYYIGEGDQTRVGKIFSNSLLLHIGLALVLGALLLSVRGLLFDHVFNIDSLRTPVARQIYVLATLMLQLSVLIAPFKAMYIAHENIVYISCVEVVDAILRVGLAIGLSHVHLDQLLFYGSMMASISGLNLIAFAAYALYRYPECRIRCLLSSVDWSILGKLTSFAGWSAYSTGCIVGRNQGLAIIFNNFWGTAINASFGIGMQVYAALSFIATSVVNAFNPQIMKAEGSGNRQHMFHLACQESKYSEMLLQLLLIPILFEMPAILHFWLGIDSDHTTLFCRAILITLLCDQCTYGLNGANQAIGHIRTYSLLMYTPKLLILPVAILLLHVGHSVRAVMYLYIAIEIAVAALRLPYMKKTAGLSIRLFLRQALMPLLPLLATQVLIGWLITQYIDIPYRFLLTLAVSMIVGTAVTYLFILSSAERNHIHALLHQAVHHSNNTAK